MGQKQPFLAATGWPLSGEERKGCILDVLPSPACRGSFSACVVQVLVSLFHAGIVGRGTKGGGRRDSDIIFLVFVFLALAGRFGGSGWLLLYHCAITLCRVTDVIPALVHLVGAFIPVTIFVHGIQQDEDTEGCGGHDSNHHPGRAAGLPDDLHGSRGASLPGASWVNCG